jgi:hypothetical protein
MLSRSRLALNTIREIIKNGLPEKEEENRALPKKQFDKYLDNEDRFYDEMRRGNVNKKHAGA